MAFLYLLCFHFFNIIINLSPVSSVTAPQDISALQSFKASIKTSSIPSWSCLASWDFTTDPCSLPRRTHFTCSITCSSDSTRVTHLTLDPAGYSGKLTPLISQLSKLIILDLSDNNFSGNIPASISSVTNLQILTLKSNSFSGNFPESLVKLKSLVSIDLSHNFLSGSLPKFMNSLSNLTRLDLSFNRLSGYLPKLPNNLLELAAKANSFSGSLPKSSFDGLTRLEVVELSENSFSGALESWFFLLPGLQQVNLANNSLTSLQVTKLVGSNSDMVAVDLGFNKIEGNLPANLAAYPLLSSLSLRHNRLRGNIPFEYGKQKNLRRLYLDGNFLTGKVPAGLISGERGGYSGSLGDNCLEWCPESSEMCSPSQKSTFICKQAYGGKTSPGSY